MQARDLGLVTGDPTQDLALEPRSGVAGRPLTDDEVGVADTAADAVTGVYGLPQRIGPRASALVGALLMVAAIGVVALGAAAIGAVALGAQSGDEVGVGLLVMALVGAVVAAVAATTGSARLAWSITLATALIGAAALIAQGTNLVA